MERGVTELPRSTSDACGRSKAGGRLVASLTTVAEVDAVAMVAPSTPTDAEWRGTSNTETVGSWNA